MRRLTPSLLMACLAQLKSVGDLTVTSFDYPNSVKLDKYPEAYNQVPDFKTWIKGHVTTDNKKLYVITGISILQFLRSEKWVLEQASDG